MDKIKENYESIKKEINDIIDFEKQGFETDEATKAVMGYLGIILDMHAAFNNTLARWENTSEAIKHLYSRQALPMLWDYIEVSPFSNSSGTIDSGLPYYLKYINFASFKRENENIYTGVYSATSTPYPDNNFDAIITDPPYYDNVPYADLSDFFYTLLKRSVGDFFPEVLSTPLTPKKEEAVADSIRHGGSDIAKIFFEKLLSDSFKEIHRILKPGGIAVIVYAHKTTSGWETVLNSLVSSGLVVTASWPIHTEMKARLRAAASAALASSIYMICRKTEREPVGYFTEIKPKIKARIEEKLQQFWNEGIAGGDFFISAIGPAMETFSKYERVEKYSGETVTIAELLEYIRSVVTDWIVNRLLKDVSSGALDKESYFYLIFRWTYLDHTVPYDDVRKLASASGIDLEEMWGRGFVKKTGSNIKVLGPKERNGIDKTENMVDVIHKSTLLWEKGKKDELNKLLSETGYGQSSAFWQFCQAIAETLLNGNKEKQLLEGLLMSKDSYMHKEERRQPSLEDY